MALKSPKQNVVMALKSPKQMERHFKGVANHRRIEILLLISTTPDLNIEEISRLLKCNMKTISQHVKYLYQSGLVSKNHRGRSVCHNLSPYGKTFVSFIKTFQRSAEH